MDFATLLRHLIPPKEYGTWLERRNPEDALGMLRMFPAEMLRTVAAVVSRKTRRPSGLEQHVSGNLIAEICMRNTHRYRVLAAQWHIGAERLSSGVSLLKHSRFSRHLMWRKASSMHQRCWCNWLKVAAETPLYRAVSSPALQSGQTSPPRKQNQAKLVTIRLKSNWLTNIWLIFAAAAKNPAGRISNILQQCAQFF